MTSQDYIDKEEATQRKPAELYHIWSGDVHYRHASGDVAIDYGGYTWEPATIQRGTVQRNTDLNALEVEVTFAKANPAITKYLANSPVDLSWIQITKLFRDQDPYEIQLIFLGQIVSVEVKGIQAQGNCRGIEHLLQQSLLTNWYQPECNHTVFDENCGLDGDSYKVTPTITLDSTETVLTAAAFGAQSDGYWTLGYVAFEGEYRFIVDHSGNDITIMTSFTDLEDNDQVTVYPGCDGDIDTCKDKFNNLDNFLGFPFIPLDNPATWIGKE